MIGDIPSSPSAFDRTTGLWDVWEAVARYLICTGHRTSAVALAVTSSYMYDLINPSLHRWWGDWYQIQELSSSTIPPDVAQAAQASRNQGTFYAVGSSVLRRLHNLSYATSILLCFEPPPVEMKKSFFVRQSFAAIVFMLIHD
jgi:hypothetical protein